ncbi:MAG: CD225/dispanin family protein [Candidatus Nanopelagicales bacterium]
MSNYAPDPNAAAQQPRVAVRAVPASWLAPAIVSTILCFSPTGVVAVYFAAQVNAFWNSGNQVAAAKASKRARTWLIITIFLWALTMVFLIATGRLGSLFESGFVSGA